MEIKMDEIKMNVVEIQCADDLAALTNEAVQQFRKSKQYRDLISAILMANHIADWHYIKDLNRKNFSTPEREEMKACYPEWDVIRQLANGTKHCNAQAVREDLQWEHSDFWSSAGHVGENWQDWFVNIEGHQRSVIVLIEDFLKSFADHSSRPK
ncbi:hypothetical protein [Aquaspirillum sp. LM1]|uniref:hypothetical protein n=1 Tax=Aquaspirillum sp. LM1 TaxID=1938604 RepID=UPI0012377B0D|nr:hypothetical protein [Aquaspirillum sp. LM1]